MRNFLKPFLIVALIISVATNAFMYQRYRNKRSVMTINNHSITQQDIYDRLIQSNGEVVKAQLTSSRLLEDAAEKEKLVPTDADIQERFDQRREADWNFARQMAINPWLEAEAKNTIRQDLELTRLLTSKIAVTEDQIKEEYATQPAAFDTPNKAYCYLALIHSDSDNMDNIKQLMDKGIATASIEQNYPKDVTFLGENTLSVDGKNTTNLFIVQQPFGSKNNQKIFEMKPGEVAILPPGEFAKQKIKALIIRMFKVVPGHPANLSDPKIHDRIRTIVAGRRAQKPNEYLLKLWEAADFRSEDPNDKKLIGAMLSGKSR